VIFKSVKISASGILFIRAKDNKHSYGNEIKRLSFKESPMYMIQGIKKINTSYTVFEKNTTQFKSQLKLNKVF
jgi:hypothetical protein